MLTKYSSAVTLFFCIIVTCVSSDSGSSFCDASANLEKRISIDSERNAVEKCVCPKGYCMRKCCPIGNAYDVYTKTCVVSQELFDPPVWDNYRVQKNVNASETFHFLIGRQECGNESRFRITKITQNFHLRTDGKMFIELTRQIPPWELRNTDEYCMDIVVSTSPSAPSSPRLDGLVCLATEKKPQDKYTFSTTCMLISCVFILATVAVYAWVPELKNLHGRVLMAYLLCLLFAFVFLSTMQIMLQMDYIYTDGCVAFTFIIYFFTEAAFFWLNIMCFDIWWTFSGKRGLSGNNSARSRFHIYAAYAFGIPIILTLLLISLEFSGLPAHPALPLIRLQGCFINGISKMLYLYGPMSILIVANIIFFIMTIVRISIIKKQTSVLKSNESATHDQSNDKKRLILYAKLFTVMGINWIMEIISEIYPEATYIWKYTDAYNILIGLVIFIIFVCKKKTFRLIKARFRQLKGKPLQRTQTHSSDLYSKDDLRMSSMVSRVSK